MSVICQLKCCYFAGLDPSNSHYGLGQRPPGEGTRPTPPQHRPFVGRVPSPGGPMWPIMRITASTLGKSTSAATACRGIKRRPAPSLAPPKDHSAIFDYQFAINPLHTAVPLALGARLHKGITRTRRKGQFMKHKRQGRGRPRPRLLAGRRLSNRGRGRPRPFHELALHHKTVIDLGGLLSFNEPISRRADDKGPLGSRAGARGRAAR